MTDESRLLREQAECAKIGYLSGEMTRKEAAERIKPYAAAFNVKSKELAAKHHMRPQKFSLTAFLR